MMSHFGYALPRSGMEEQQYDFERTVEDWHWWYQGRRHILDQLMQGLTLDRRRARLLDIGCGTGGSSLVLSRYGAAVALDRSAKPFSISMDRPYAHRVAGTAERLPFAGQSFDAAIALDVLEHLDDDVAGAREIHRVLRPGGAAVVFVPAFSVLWGQNDVRSHHRRRYRKEDLARTLRAAGLAIEKIGYFNCLLFLPALVMRSSERWFPEWVSRVEYRAQPTTMNRLLAATFRLELPLLRRRGLPFGTSVFCLARRD